MDSSAGAARAVPRLVGAIVTVSSNLLQRYCNLVDLLELVMGLMFYIGPTVGAKCSVRLTWDVFVRDLNCQLGTPSHWIPVDSCKEGQKGRPSGRLHSDAQVSQQETPKTMHLCIEAPRMAL